MNQTASSETTETGPYSQWAGQNQIAGAGADQYGNARGSQYDLIQDGSVTEAKIVVLNRCSAEIKLDKPKAALERKGFTLLELRDCAGLAERLADAAEFCVAFCAASAVLSGSFVRCNLADDYRIPLIITLYTTCGGML